LALHPRLNGIFKRNAREPSQHAFRIIEYHPGGITQMALLFWIPVGMLAIVALVEFVKYLAREA
jgi:hypothetical protein